MKCSSAAGEASKSSGSSRRPWTVYAKRKTAKPIKPRGMTREPEFLKREDIRPAHCSSVMELNPIATNHATGELPIIAR